MKAICLLLIAALIIFSMTACAREPAQSEETYPTLPSIPQEQTPLELLTAAINSAKDAASCTVQYGTVTKNGDEMAKDIHSQTVTPEQSFNMETLYRDVPNFPTNKNLLSDFCSMPLRVIPSNDGTFRYELTELGWEELWTLMYGPSTAETKYDEFAQVLCTVAMEVDASGCFSRLELTVELYTAKDQLERTVTIFLSAENFG